MIAVKITLETLEEADSLTQQVIEQSSQAIADDLANLAENILAEAESNLQNNMSVNTGELIGSLQVFDSGENFVEFGSDLFYAIYVEEGRGEIVPVNKKALHFFTKDGKEVFAKHVGPSLPRPFMMPAILKFIPKFEQMLSDDDRIVPKDAT